MPFAQALGLDFGTSNSTAGWWRGTDEPLLALEDGQPTLPSVIFFNAEERRPAFGRQALSEYLDDYEGRLMRSLKSLLGSTLLKSETAVLGSSVPFTEVLGLYLSEIKKRAEQQAGVAFEQVVLGRPVFFVDDDPEADQEAAQTLEAVAKKIGFKEVSFQYEPIAAAFDYERNIEREERVLIIDIGGGTSDFSVVRLAPERREHSDRQHDILATAGIHIGGTDFDKQLNLDSVMPLLGYGGRMRSDAFMPTHYHLNLATWHTINSLYAKKSQLALKNMRYDVVDPTGIDRLITLLEQRAGHWLSMEVEAGKIALSQQDAHLIALNRIEKGLSAELSRAGFEACIAPLLARIQHSLQAVLNDAGVSAESIDTVFFTGGSSSIGALRDAVQQLVPNARVTQGNTFGSIGSGLAIEAQRRYR